MKQRFYILLLVVFLVLPAGVHSQQINFLLHKNEGIAELPLVVNRKSSPTSLRVVVEQDVPKMNGFVLSNLLVPRSEIHRGGPPRDGIPSIDNPQFILAAEATFMTDDEMVLGLRYNGVTKAFALRILDQHEIVNDQFGSTPVAITYCPLCNSGMGFNRNAGGLVRSFGVSGLLYQSDVLMYDRETESLWSQIQAMSVAGRESGTRLELLPLVQTTWGAWRKKYPETLVLSENTGFRRDYDREAYSGYHTTQRLMFPVDKRDDRLQNKAIVLGITHDGIAKAYPLNTLHKTDTPVKDRIGELEILVHYDRDGKTAFITDANGNVLPAVTLYWFAWFAFQPETEVFER